MWRLGYTPTDWSAPADPRVVATTHRHGNFDYATGAVQWAPGFDQALPDSLYLTGRPAFFGDRRWPWVDPTGATPVHTLPARERYDLGRPIDSGLIFADGFQTGDLSRWSSASADGGDLAVSASAALALTVNGLRGVVDDRSGLYVQDDSPAGESDFRARFYVDPNGFDPGEASGRFRTRIFVAFAENPARRLATVVLRRIGGAYAVMASCRLDDLRKAETGFVPVTDAPHAVEITWRRARSPLLHDGSCQLFVDGQPAGLLAALDNDGRGVDFARLGALSVKSGASGTLFWDEYDSRRDP
jgi:hypothetical protein